MEHSIARLVAQFGGSLAARGSHGWDVVISAGTMLYQWKGRRVVPDMRLETTGTGRLIRPYGEYHVVRLNGKQSLVMSSDAMLAMRRPLTKARLSDRMERLLVHQYIQDKRPIDPYRYERLTDDQAVRFADGVLQGNWYIPAAPDALRVADVDAFDWDQMVPRVDNNSFRLQLHYLTTVHQLTRAFEVTGETAYVEHAARIVDSWHACHPVFAVNRKREAYHEHGTAIRVFHLLGFFEAYRCARIERDPSMTEKLLKMLYDHAVLLATPTFYRPRHNHGMFQDMALFAVASCFPEFDRSPEWERVARARLDAQIDTSLAADGTHLEHSPGYHVYVYHMLRRFVDWANVNGFLLSDRFDVIDRMPDRLVHLIKPNRTLPMVGDTGGQIRGRHLIPRVDSYPSLDYALSGGQEGVCPSERMVNLGSNYAVMREYWAHLKRPFSDATHILMTAGYHGAAHKHADDLSLELYGLGRDFIVEMGRYGYADCEERSEAMRVTSHNTVHRLGDELDLSVERIGESGIVSVEPIGKQVVSTGVSRLIGKGALHTRKVVYDQARTLVVFDRITSPEPDLFVQRFHVAPGLDLVEGSTESQNVRFMDTSNRAMQIVQLMTGDESYMTIEESHVSARDFEWVSRPQVVSIECGTDVRFLTLIRLDRTNSRIVQTQVEETGDRYIVSYWLESGTKHVIRIPY
ncbi:MULTISPECIES: heparinase II/III family protein [unclassified Exiguobacterium]|uniref:heparinase II/III family protein n=1 Tax=unclassified Exiguobacterium TaxID=2644629 RepID=UPI001BED24DC|nr:MULTISPECIES: heparinase II/III family protein [unclassified Exiguobacterium]